MKIISVEELVMQKILTFDLYNENGEKVMNAGEILTPGKLLQLHHISALYREDFDQDEYIFEEDDDEDDSFVVIREEIAEEIPVKKDISNETKNKYIDNFENNEIFITPKSQCDIKTLFTEALDKSVKKESGKTKDICIEARDRIVEQVLPMVDEIVYKSQLKIEGDYNYSHGINVSMLSTALASRLGYNETMIRDIALGAMLHDLGKSRIPPEIFEKNIPTKKETQIIQMHTLLGYKILKEEMKLPEHVARIALEHHERNDGTGYPYGISGELISPATNIVIVCDIYDDLTSGKGHVAVKNPKEAVKVMMEIGTKWFAPNVLYSFVYMSNFNDLSPT
ncbi:MAG: HD domain-containing protein [Candidatus Gastranaerophilales bacterium]|nr:HD domain-containing protein [Candidatus Gastranaerophilales bacterium]